VEDAIEEMVKLLETLGIKDDTVIVYNSDNGFAWGEHGFNKKNCAYEECARIPLVILDPRRPQAGRKEETFVLNADLAPTFAELAGVKAEGKMDGQSLVPFFLGQGFKRDKVLIECWGPGEGVRPPVHAAIRTEQWKYIEHFEDWDRKKPKKRKDGSPEIELYDLKKDPFELENLARSKDAKAIIDELAPKLSRLREE
jgi:arylsulfatase A-like enzyme